jgi:hypothetical protein
MTSSWQRGFSSRQDLPLGVNDLGQVYLDPMQRCRQFEPVGTVQASGQVHYHLNGLAGQQAANGLVEKIGTNSDRPSVGVELAADELSAFARQAAGVGIAEDGVRPVGLGSAMVGHPAAVSEMDRINGSGIRFVLSDTLVHFRLASLARGPLFPPSQPGTRGVDEDHEFLDRPRLL